MKKKTSAKRQIFILKYSKKRDDINDESEAANTASTTWLPTWSFINLIAFLSELFYSIKFQYSAKLFFDPIWFLSDSNPYIPNTIILISDKIFKRFYLPTYRSYTILYGFVRKNIK